MHALELRRRIAASLAWRWGSFYDRRVLRIPPRAENAYATHLPILVAIGAEWSVRRVLELGSGTVSTTAFLDQECFPDLQLLTSYENDRTWIHEVLAAVGNDKRLDLVQIDGEIAHSLQQKGLEDYDLLLVDDSQSGVDRAATITMLARIAPANAMVVIHDYEYPPYRRAARRFKHRFRFDALTPNTAIVWNHNRPIRSLLETWNEKLRVLPLELLDNRPLLRSWIKNELVIQTNK